MGEAKREFELLAPARDVLVGKAAIDNGADAVYIGGPAFGARKSAANTPEDIAELAEYAHRFYCRVFVALNTVLFDSELAEAEKMIRRLYRIGVDALIIQDPGILKLDLPPISLHASTQMHNYDMERIRFLDRLGFRRIVLARELSLEQIRAIRKEVKAELEVFIHGALCVSMSGQCYLSQHMFGRSANRGECAQPCRMRWSLKDARGKVWAEDRHLLSLKDLNLSNHIPELMAAGVDSFKIEGRLKDAGYVANVTNHYHRLLEKAMEGFPECGRAGSGVVEAAFAPDPERSFNRGSSSYFLTGRQRGLVNMDTPKSMGKPLGRVLEAKGRYLSVDTREEIANGDGLCFLKEGELQGLRVNVAAGNRVETNEEVDVAPGTMLFRNYDRRFAMMVEKRKSVRRIRIRIGVEAHGGNLRLVAADEDGVMAETVSGMVFEKADNPQQLERIVQQLKRCGDTCFLCEEVNYSGEPLFVRSSELNGLKKRLLEELEEKRKTARRVVRGGVFDDTLPYRETVDWRDNVTNGKARDFYLEHGAKEVADGFEKGGVSGECDLMRSRYCILYELGYCRKTPSGKEVSSPVFLYNEKHCFKLEFDCAACEMRVTAPL